ncbi:MAG: cytochrome c [Gammaproteobacteria bacterium]|nr:cytochrome c [Gammaproteobacteria bacterium]
MARYAAYMATRAAAAALLLLTSAKTGSEPPSAAAGPGLGQPVSDAEIAVWDIGVFPDGTGLPPGRGDARQGREIYRRHCLSCHGARGKGGSAMALAGAQYGLTGDYPQKTVGTYWPYAATLFDFNRRAMPMQAPGSLTDDEVYAVTAYLLFLNGIVGEDERMDAVSLPRVQMPNRDGFLPMAAPPRDAPPGRP